MGIIKIKGKKEGVTVPNEVARQIKARWLGLSGEQKRSPDSTLDLGDEWSGYYGDIKSVELEKVATQQKQRRNTVSEQQAKEFAETKLKKYLDKKGILTLRNELKFLADMKAIRVTELNKDPKIMTDFEIAILGDEGAEKYAMYMDYIESWKAYMGRVEFAKKKDMASLENSLKSIGDAFKIKHE